MKKKLFTVILFIINLTAISQTNNFYIGFRDTSQISMTIKFKFANNLVVIPIQVNGSDTLFFILDTGIRPTLLTSFTGDYEFQVTGSSTIKGLGEGEDLKVWHTFDNVLKIKDIVMTMQNIFVMEKDKFEMDKKMGIPVNGIIGNVIFENFIVEIDYEKKIITFYNPKKFKYTRKHNKWISYPLKIYQGKPYTKMKVQINEDTIIYADLLVDLGASDALWLFYNSSDSIPKPENEKSYYLGQGLNGDIFGQQGTVPKLFLTEKIYLENVTVSYPDSSGLNVPADYDIPGRNGTIGSEILRRFDVIFDYGNQKMLLKKNSNFYDNFNFDLSGMEIITPFAGLRIYTIFYVQKNSPADKAGLKAEDQIIKINGLSATEYTLNDILLILRSKEGRKIKIIVNRDGQEISTLLTLDNYRI